MEKAREATLEVAKEEAPKAKGSKEESKAAMIFGHREYGVPVLSIMEEPSLIYADLVYDSSGSRILFAGTYREQHPFEE